MKILVFGEVAERIGASTLEIDFKPTTVELVAAIYERYPSLQSLQFAIAVDHILIETVEVLKETSEVALLPPFSGG